MDLRHPLTHTNGSNRATFRASLLTPFFVSRISTSPMIPACSVKITQ